MKKPALVLSLLACSFLSYGQTTLGLVAHWDMDSSVHDVSGHGHDGHAMNLIPAPGMDGVPGHAYYFNGTNAGITIPYMPDLNVSSYTISSRFKVSGFYTGACHGNILFSRGTTANGYGNYYLEFTDYPAGYGCTTAIDTMSESFMPMACASGTSLLPSTFTPFDHTPHVQTNMWYTVVATFNDTVFKVYVNNVLKTTVTCGHPGMPMGVSTDSASIGFCVYDAGIGYPYWFHGVMDDLRFYDRVLTDSEIIDLNPASLSVAQVVKEEEMIVYPDPVTNTFFVQTPLSGNATRIVVLDQLGRVVADKVATQATTSVDISSQPAGIYYVRAICCDKAFNKKIVKY